ncbi:MAG: phosphatidylserine decarboxylase family protein [Bacteroidota bacterium]
MKIRIHREGIRIIAIFVIILIVLNYIIYLYLSPSLLNYIINLVSLLLLIFIFRFFRKPYRSPEFRDDLVFSSADGKVVAIEEVFEKEYFHEKRLMISVFMSVWNVHINWFPVRSRVKYYKYHPGKYLIASLPKSSELNERNTTVLEMEDKTEILIRQIAGFVARRISYYSQVGEKVKTGDEMGFIRFGSRVDIYLPPDAEPTIKPGDRVKGIITPIALLKKP